jgi:hypothetical protein
VVVKGLEERTSKGGVEVLPLHDLGSYQPHFVSSISELEYLDKMIAKYTRGGEIDFVRDLERLKRILEMEQ